MGQVYSHDCVDLSQLPPSTFEFLCNETYTVLRTDGREEAGWRIEAKSHSSVCGIPPWIKAHASNRFKSRDDGTYWKVYMNNGFCCLEKKDDLRAHGCGWRRVGTFWPTRLETPIERQEWDAWITDHLETLTYPPSPSAPPEPPLDARVSD